MPCRFLVTQREILNRTGSTPQQKHQYLCSLKLDSEKQRSIIHQILVKKGIDEPYISDNCPFGDSCSQTNCPYYMI